MRRCNPAKRVMPRNRNGLDVRRSNLKMAASRSYPQNDPTEDFLRANLARGILVDPEDEVLLKDHLWTVVNDKSGIRAIRNSGKEILHLSRVVMKASKNDGAMFDHINRNRLDNRKENLRKCTYTENNRNQSLRTTYAGVPVTSRFKGVSFDKSRGKYRATIVVNKKQRYLGAFDCERDAARVYDKAAREAFGEFAATNEDLYGDY